MKGCTPTRLTGFDQTVSDGSNPNFHIRCKIGTPLLVVWDRLNAHRSQVTTAFIAAHPQDYAVAYLPTYAPDLDP